MIDIIGLYDTLLNASIGGVPFQILDTRVPFGRRVQRFLFPGVDAPVFQDMGVLDGAISVTGILIGDDYVSQAARLNGVLRAPGPLTLVHPWLGSLAVVLSGGNAASISFVNTELRCARFSVSVFVFQVPPPVLPDTLARLLGACAQTVADAESWMAAVLAPTVLPLAVFAYASGWVRRIAVGFAGLVNSGASAAPIGASAGPAIVALGGVTPNAASAGVVAAAVAAVPGAIVAAAQPVVPSAVAPGGVPGSASMAVVAAMPADAVAMLLLAVPVATVGAGDPAPGPALAAALQAVIVADAIQASALVVYDSVQAAQAQAALLMGVIDAAIVAAATAAQISAQLAAPVWDDLVALKSALAADTNALVGRLPSVVTVTTLNVLPAWLIAHYVAGDVPGQMYATYGDLVARNRVVNPALVPAGALEVLQVA